MVRGSRALFLFMSAAIFLFSTPGHASVTPYTDLFGNEVGSVSFSIESPFSISFLELSSLVGIDTGEIFTKEMVEKSIRALNKKGVFKRISLFGELKGGKVDLVFVLIPSVPLVSMNVSGSKYFGGKEILSRLRIRKGTPVTSFDVEEIRKRLEMLYKENGYYQVESDIKIGCNLGNGNGSLLITVKEGRRPLLSDVSIHGNMAIGKGDIMDVLRVTRGETVNLRKVKERIARLRKRYRTKGYLTFRAGEPELSPVAEGVLLTLSLNEGDHYDLEFRGNRKFSESKLVTVSGLLDEAVTYEAGIIDRVGKNIKSFYQSKGYPEARVDIYPLNGKKRKLVIEIEEGVRGAIREINFTGNENFDDKELEGVMDTGKRRFYSFITGSGFYDRDLLENDIEKVRGYYQSKGFPNAKVWKGEAGLNEKGRFAVGIEVEEGKKFFVKHIRLKNVTFFADREIYDDLGNKPGTPIDYVAAYGDVFAIQKRYLDAGFDDCKVNISFDMEEEDNSIGIVYTVFEGVRFSLGRVVITGNSDVSSDVVLRELPVKRGEFVGESMLIKFQQRLFRTGMFRNIKIDRVKDYGTNEMNLLIRVTEAKFLLMEWGLGYGTDTGMRGSLNMRHININGEGRSLGGSLDLSEKDSIFSLDMKEPWFMGRDLEGTLRLTAQTSKEESFDLEEYSVVGGVNKSFWERSSFSLQLEFDKVRTFNVAPDAVLSPDDVGDKKFVLIRPILVFDQRDDPFNPKSGTFNSILFEFSLDFLGSSRGYYKVTGQSAYYRELGKKFVLALSARGGYAEPLEGEVLPIDKRFFAGGRTTVRGFLEDFLGPIGVDGSPIGGDTMVILNGEIRYSLSKKFVLGLFVDAGSVWLREVDQFGFDMRETAGYSIKYITPVGPVSFDMGYKLDRKENESASEWYITIGAAF